MTDLTIGNIYKLKNDPYHVGSYLCEECDTTIEDMAFLYNYQETPHFFCVSCGTHLEWWLEN